MPVLDGPMTMPVLDGVKPMAITHLRNKRVFVLKEKKKAYIAGLGRDQLEHLASPMTKSETSPSPNTNESKTSPRRLKNVSSPDSSPRPDSSTTALVPEILQFQFQYGSRRKLLYCTHFQWTKNKRRSL